MVLSRGPFESTIEMSTTGARCCSCNSFPYKSSTGLSLLLLYSELNGKNDRSDFYLNTNNN